VEWVRKGKVFAPALSGDPDGLRAWRPWVLEEDDGTLRMWYSGHDGTTGRILEAVRRPGKAWQRLGIAIEPGLAGESDGYGVESPCVVKVPGGYLMVYGGSDGEHTRLHMATSSDSQRWVAQGTIMQRREEDALAATHPCLLVMGERWWLFYSGYDGSHEGRRAAILAAVSPSGASWDRLGRLLSPEADELAASHPCLLDISRRFQLFYASDDGERVSIALATSADGVLWERRGVVLSPSREGPDALAVHTPCVVRLRDGSLWMWYAGRPLGDTELAYQICEATFPGSWPTQMLTGDGGG
jgi:predicted GH43/DUF377 family glycosyl hydrolase